MNDNDETWLGRGREVRRKVRNDMLSVLYIDRDKGVMEQPPSDEAVDSLCDTIVNLHESLRPAYLSWWKSGKLEEDFEVEGFTYSSIRERLRRVSVSTAFHWFDGLRRDLMKVRSILYGYPSNRSSMPCIVSLVDIPADFQE